MATRRRGTGEGSVRQRSDGVWEARYTRGYANGKRLRGSLYGHTRAEVVRRLGEALRGVESGQFPTPASLSVGTFLTEWLAQTERGLRPSTAIRYRGLVERHLVPALGSKKLAQLRPQDVTAALNQALDRGMAPRSVHHLRAVLRAALNDGMRWGTLHRNVAALSEPVRVPDRRAEAMTPDEARAILAATRGTDIEAPVGVALYTGMRLGEVLGLRWRNIDLDDGQLRVDAGLQRLNRATRLVETKTERSRRLLPVTEDLTLILRDQQRRQAAQRRAAGANWIDPIPDLVFTNAVGQPLVPTTVTGRFKELLRLAGAPPRRFHDLRHGCATLLLASGTDLKVVSNMLGHSTINITANTYAHVLPALERDASVRLSNLIRAGGRNTGG